MNRSRGFTLLEMIIAMALLASMTIFLAKSIKSANKNKRKIQSELDRTSTLNDALNIMARDIQMAFHYRDPNIELFNAAQKERQKRLTEKRNKKPSGTPPPDGGESAPTNLSDEELKKFTLKVEKQLTEFRGEKENLDFTTLSNVRSQKDQQTSDQAEVGYFLKKCRNRVNKSLQSQCLWRRLSPVIDDSVDEGGRDIVLLENVDSMKLRYIGPEEGGEPKWRDEWKSGEGGDAVTKGKFPYAVEVTIEVINKNLKKDKPMAMTSVTTLRFPNNPVEKTTEETSDATSGALTNE